MRKNTDKFYFGTADEAEAAFYSAFGMADIGLMDSVLGDQNICCIHPNAKPIIGRAAVLSCWHELFSGLDETTFNCEVIHRSIQGNDVGDTAIHLVAENISPSHQIGVEISLVYATNVYIKQENGWRIMMHHTSLPPTSENEGIENDPLFTHAAPQTMQ